MPRKNVLPKYQIITNGSMTGTSVLTSSIVNIDFIDNVGMSFIWSSGSTPVGTCSVEVSINYNPVDASGTWTAISFSSTPSVSGNSGSIYLDMNQLSAPWIRAKYTNTSGTGTMNAFIVGKEV